jgi:hypothetical protein
VRRLFPTLLVIALLGGTAAAFALTEGLKLQKEKITAARVDKVFSPTCGCSTDYARIRFRIPRADVVSVSIVSGGHVVRTLAQSAPVDAGWQQFDWDGTDGRGHRLKDGSYRPRVQLEDAGRTFTLPNPIALDTKPPQIRFGLVTPKAFSPDGDFRRDLVRVHYRVNEPARALLYVNGKRRIYARLIAAAGSFVRWRARGYPAGRYALVLRAQDAAGNISASTKPVFVRIRYVELEHHVVRAHAGRGFKVGVVTDALAFHWRFGRRSGTGHDHVLHLRADRPGWYRLSVTANGHTDHGVVRVAAR